MTRTEGWEANVLSDLVTINYGQSPTNILDNDGPYPVVGTGSCQRKGKSYIHDGESIILGRKGTIDQVHFIKGKFWAIDTAYYLTRFDQTIPRWLYYCFQSINLRQLNEATGVPSLSRNILYKIQISTPPVTEQRKIAHILTIVDQAIEQMEALIAKQQRIKSGLMQDLLTRGIDEQGNVRSEKTHQFKDSLLGKIPVEWEVGGLINYVVNDSGIKPGPFGSSLTKDMYLPSGYRVFGQEQVIGGSLDIGDYFISRKKFIELESFAVRAGDVLISLVGTIGHVLVVPKDHQSGLINPRLLRFRPDQKYCLPEFLRYLILSHSSRQQLDVLATGGTMAVISAGIIRKLCAVVVGNSEQARITQILEKFDRCILESFKSLSKLRALKIALMQDLLTGRKRVTALLHEKEMVNA